MLSEEVHQLLNSAKMKTFDDQKRTELVFRHVTMFFIVFVCLVFFPSVFFSDMNDSQMQMGFLKLCNF